VLHDQLPTGKKRPVPSTVGLRLEQTAARLHQRTRTDPMPQLISSRSAQLANCFELVAREFDFATTNVTTNVPDNAIEDHLLQHMLSFRLLFRESA
jgi:hypothetical protein